MYEFIHYPSTSKDKKHRFFQKSFFYIKSFCDIDIEIMPTSPISFEFP